MRRFVFSLLVTATVIWPGTPRAEAPAGKIEGLAATLASKLASVCPPAAYNDMSAFTACSSALASTDLPFTEAVLWGGDQPNLRVKKRKLTHFNAGVFQRMYLPLMTFTGRWSVGRDEREKVDVIRLEAFFRNGLPSGEYPYPFWHSADKWSAYETMNQVSFYVDDMGRIFVVTRSAAGSDSNRGQYARVQPPAFEANQWTWVDQTGQAQPQVTLFSARYQATNPHLPRLDSVYRTFASDMRQASCVSCHNPTNPQGVEWLTLLQTPAHAAGEVDRVIKAVQDGSMPQDDIGLRKEIDPSLRASILHSAQVFRDELTAADEWESKQPFTDNVATRDLSTTRQQR